MSKLQMTQREIMTKDGYASDMEIVRSFIKSDQCADPKDQRFALAALKRIEDTVKCRKKQ